MLDAWATLCGANRDNDSLVQELEMGNRLKSRRVADALRKVQFPNVRLHFSRQCNFGQ